MKLLKAVLCALLVIGSPAVFAAKLVPIETQTIVVSHPDGKALTIDQIRTAIKRGANRHSWSLQSEGSNGYIARQTKPKFFAVVSIQYTPKEITIKYRSSDGLRYRKDGGGAEVIHSTYMRWVRNLRGAIEAEISAL